MLEEAVGQVRSFNRLVTQRVGALNDRYLSRDRPLGEARLLWEIGGDGSRRAAAARRGSTSTRAISAGCSARSRRPASSASSRARTTGACAPCGSPPRRPRRARAARPAQRRARPLVPRAARATRGATRLVAAMAEVERLLTARARRDQTRSTRRSRRAAVPPGVLRRARPALRERLRPRA